MFRNSVRDIWSVLGLSQSAKRLCPLQESGHRRMVIAYAFTLLSSYSFSSLLAVLHDLVFFKFRLLFCFGVLFCFSLYFSFLLM
jgi:hypothetical protein